ncbi:hypothetical protein [Ralstonia pseudosolanacearum]|uniref:hypothetical protein n=1 Tax=Ralstonia pseudosolanacearum TaxID=1310165 RepID=UPI001FF84FEC|nr:hypothetical protein [Ralstonia pseudosolanacearum]
MRTFRHTLIAEAASGMGGLPAGLQDRALGTSPVHAALRSSSPFSDRPPGLHCIALAARQLGSFQPAVTSLIRVLEAA